MLGSFSRPWLETAGYRRPLARDLGVHGKRMSGKKVFIIIFKQYNKKVFLSNYKV
jgi:hypothetical protein